VPWKDGRPEALHAVHATRDAAAAQRALDEGVRRLADYLARIPHERVEAADLAHLAGAARTFRNVNSPEDLEA
jgi:molybdopterin-guanine dinucleotide biosynthesis protein A